MTDSKISKIFGNGWQKYCRSFQPNEVQERAAFCIMNCKSDHFGYNIQTCEEYGFTDMHANSCRNRNCPNCQAVLKEVWIDKRRSEVIDSPYFHVVFTIPAELNPLFYSNQKLLYNAPQRRFSNFSGNKKYLGAAPGIIQVLHTWGQDLNYHPYMYCIVSGGGLTKDRKLRTCGRHFFIPAKVLAVKFKGKLMSVLKGLHDSNSLMLSGSCARLHNR